MSRSTDEAAQGDNLNNLAISEFTGRKLTFAENELPATVRFEQPIDSNNAWDKHEEGETTPRVLDPEHPLLARFQKTLKEHLEKQIEHLLNEVVELEAGAKQKKDDCEQLSIETYEAQQIVNKQQQDLEMCIVELDNVCSATEQMECQLGDVKKAFTQKQQELLKMEEKEVHLRTEVDGLNLMMQQIKQMESDIESELTINQRVFEKTRKDNIQLVLEKRQLDVIIYKLMTEIWRLEEELETMDMQIRVKEEERENLADTVASGNIELNTITGEHRALLNSWNTLVVAISQRNKYYNQVKDELNKLSENLRSMSAEIDQTKKLCQKEMQQNERLTAIKCHIEEDIENSVRLIELENKKRDNLTTQMTNTQMIIDQTESDVKRISAENKNKAYELMLEVKEFEKLSLKKVTMEDQILKTFEEQLTNDNAAKYMTKVLQQIKEQNKNNEINLGNVENANAKILMDIETQKCANEEMQRFLDEIGKQHNLVEQEIDGYTNEVEKLRFMANKKQREIDVYNAKISRVMNQQGGTEMSPEELKILTLEKNIEEIKENIKELQKFWLRHQGYVVSLSHQRQDQINDVNMLKKQLQLSIQKNLKINDELDTYKKQDERLNRFITQLQNRLVSLNEQVCKKRGFKEFLTNDNDAIQFDYTGKLEDAEMDSIKIQCDITDIEEDKVNLSKELIELNREALAWEKKIQMAVETKKGMDKERGEGGEVDNMKVEIHRMHVRYSQLKKAQEKLIQDLEHCILRRETIMTISEAREKKDKGGVGKTRMNFTRRMDDTRNKTRQIKNEIEAIEQKIEVAKEEERRLLREISITKADMDSVQRKIENVTNNVEIAKTKRQKNLEILVLKQKKLKVYSELSKGRTPFLMYRSDQVIATEHDKQKETHNKLIGIVENLLSDFPAHVHALTRINNTLQLPLLYLYK